MVNKIVRDVNDHKGVIGGSMIGGALGLSTYKSPYQTALTFLGKEEPVTAEKQAIFDMGHELEGFIAKQIERLYGVKLKATRYAYVNPTYDWLICHPDRLVVGKIDGKRIGVEIKSSSAFDNQRWGAPDTDEVPMDYLCQCHSYIMCGVCDEVWLFRFSNNKVTRYIITKDEVLETTILTKLADWVVKVQGGWLPPIDDYAEATAVYRRDTDGDIEADADTLAHYGEWKKISQHIKDLEDAEKKEKAFIVSYMKDKRTLVDDMGNKLASYIKIDRNDFDKKRFEQDHPDLLKAYTKTSSYMKLS